MMTVTGLTEPMTVISENRMQLFNETFVLLLSYHLLPLTDFVTNVETRNIVGQSLIVMTLFNLVVNILLSLL
jgi:hypothetical protein